MPRTALVLCIASLAACASGRGPADAGDAGGASGGSDAGDAGTDAGPVPFATLVDATFTVAEHMRAGREMQLSGEPFAQLLGYNLAGFNRTLSVTDQYLQDPATNTWVTDPLGYALAVESYEYSKQPMNNLSFELGAGLSLMFGPVLNPAQAQGDAGYAILLDRFQQFALEANAGAPTNALIVSPAPIENPLNVYGWPGLWPVFAEFSRFDPTIAPIPGTINTCTFSGSPGVFAYGGGVQGGSTLFIANYECDYNSLNLLDREGQVTKVLAPDALGYAVWKQGLWTINYWQTLQDTAGNAITAVAPADLSQVGQPGNTVVGFYVQPGAPSGPTGQSYDAGAPGVYLGDIPMEGWQGLTMLEEMDNKAQLLLSALLSSDGAHLTGADLTNGSDPIAAALAYDYQGPPLYFPAQVSAVEMAQVAEDAGAARKFFPVPAAFTIADGSSALAGLSGLIGGFGEAFAMADGNNPQVGGSVPFQATFDGDPFPPDDQVADGEATLHDRALGVLKIALVDLDRLHLNPAGPALADTATVSSGGVTAPGTTVTTVELCEAILALRNAYRALNGSLQLYSNDTPDTLGAQSALDGTPTAGAVYTGTLSSRLTALIALEADFLTSKLVSPSGAVANGYDLAAQTADPSPTDLAAEAGAIRALLDAYLATSKTQYRATAEAIFQDLDARFWMADVLAYRTTADADGSAATPLQYTPERFGMLHGALRQYYKLVASAASDTATMGEVLGRIKRTFKLVVNGWDDLNQDDKIDYPAECLPARLEMGERALTAELGNFGDDGDREHDCIREISYVQLPAALASEVDLVLR